MRQLFLVLFLFLTLNSGFSLQQIQEFDFRGLKLGMTKDEVFNTLSSQWDVKIDQTRYLGKINDEYPYTLKAYIYPFVRHIYVEFYKNQAYVISLQYNVRYFDFFQLTQKLEDKYGTPSHKTSKVVRWESDKHNIKLNLEYPTTVKVYDQDLLMKMHFELSNNTTIWTNKTIRQQQKEALLDEL